MKRILSTLSVLSLAFAMTAFGQSPIPAASCCQGTAACCDGSSCCDEGKCCEGAACCHKNLKPACCDGDNSAAKH
jgi:hypothetical protein